MSQIMIVDDEMGIRELLSEILSDEGHQVLLAENAESARRLRERQRPDLVLLDIWMPDTDGITLLKEWAASGQLTMPVVMITGFSTEELAVQTFRAGASDYLKKPVDVDHPPAARLVLLRDRRRGARRLLPRIGSAQAASGRLIAPSSGTVGDTPTEERGRTATPRSRS